MILVIFTTQISNRIVSHIFNYYSRKLKCKNKSGVKSSKEIVNPGLKSLNSTYIDLLLRSEKFRNDAMNYLEENFVQDYIKTRYKKIDKLLSGLNKIISSRYLKFKNGIVDDVIFSLFGSNITDNDIKYRINKEIREQILFNSKFKLPWSNFELEEVKDFAKILFAKYCI